MRSVENEECVENAEYGNYGGWKMRSIENAKCGKCGVCGNAFTLTDLFISKHFNAFIQHEKCLEMFYS